MSFVTVRVESVVATPVALSLTVRVMSRGVWYGHPTVIEIRFGAFGPWSDDLRTKVTGSPTGSLVGKGLQLEYAGTGLVALWAADKSWRLPVPNHDPAPKPVDSVQLHRAVKYVNRRRNGIQAPLEVADGGHWSTRANPWEKWTDADVIAEAERLGWRP